MKNIDDDFDIFKVVKENKDYYKNNILDSALYEFKAAAVQYTFGTTALVLFQKGTVTERQFKESIMKEYKDVRIQKIDVLDQEQCTNTFYYKSRLLAQLLINSMRTPRHESFTYHNLTGKLFYHDPSWISRDKKTKEITFIRFLEVVIDPGMYLNLEHKTFKKYNYDKWGRLYIIDPKTGEFRKKLKIDEVKTTYVEGSLPHNHFTVNNFDIKDYEKFKKSKMGIIGQFLKDVKEKLSKYITIEFEEREDAKSYEISKLEKKGISEKEYGDFLKKRGVVIVDENDTERSKEIIKLLQKELKKSYDVEAVVGELSKDAYNIRIIHDKEYYENNEIVDPHGENKKGYIVQHVTEEAEVFQKEKGYSPAIRKIVQELILKGDVRDGFISIYDWKRLDSGKEWSFIIREKVKVIEEETNNNKKLGKKRIHNYYRLKINREGKMEFDTFCDVDALGEEEEKICFEYDNIKDKQYRAKNSIDGLIYSSIDNIHAIILTKEKTLPDIEVLMDTLRETNEKEQVSKEMILKGIREFEVEYPEYKEYIVNWKENFKDANGYLTKAQVKKLLNMRTKASSTLNRYFHEKYNLWIDGELRKNEFEATYQIGNLLNIRFRYNETDYVNDRSFAYYVGAKSKKRSYPNACCIRKVVALGEKIEYEELLPLMAVDFVRNNQYTVLPFPYKYLREYVAQM